MSRIQQHPRQGRARGRPSSHPADGEPGGARRPRRDGARGVRGAVARRPRPRRSRRHTPVRQRCFQLLARSAARCSTRTSSRPRKGPASPPNSTRALRTRIMQTSHGGAAHTVLVTSPGRREGKSLTAAQSRADDGAGLSAPHLHPGRRFPGPAAASAVRPARSSRACPTCSWDGRRSKRRWSRSRSIRSRCCRPDCRRLIPPSFSAPLRCAGCSTRCGRVSTASSSMRLRRRRWRTSAF